MVNTHGFGCLIHFLLNEARPLLIFYIGWKGLLTGCGTFVWWDNTNVEKVPPRFLNQTLEEYSACVASDVAAAASSFTSPFRGVCVHMHWNPWGYLNYTCLGLIVVFIIVVGYHIFKLSCRTKDGKPLSWQSGRFVRYTTFMQSKWWYKTVSYIFLSYTFCAVVVVVYVGMSAKSPFSFVTSQGPSLILTIGGAFSFTKLHKPSFAMHNDYFKKLKFKRGCMGLLNQSNDDLCKAMEQALYNAKWEDYKLLEDLVDVKESGITEANREDFLSQLNPYRKKQEIAQAAAKKDDDQKNYQTAPQ